MSTTHSSFESITTALVTKLLVIEQLLHPALKFALSAPWPTFQLCPSSQQILATPSRRSMFYVIATATTCAVVPSFRHSAHCRYWPPAASICVWENMCCSTHTQQLWQQKFFCCRPSGVEHLAITSAAWHVLQTFQACTWKDICLGYSRPRRIVTSLICFRVP